MFLIMTDIDPHEQGEALARIEYTRTRYGGADDTHALATGVKPRGNDQGRGGGARRYRGGRGNARSKREGKGHQHHHHQQQWASQPPVQYQQKWASQPPAQQQQSQKQQRQPQQQQRQPHQQRPSGHPGRVGTTACLFLSWPAPTFLCRMSIDTSHAAKHLSPSTYTTPQGDQQANYSASSPGDCASSSGEHGQLMPTPPAPHGPPEPSVSSWSFSTDRAVMTQFCPPSDSVYLGRIVSSSSAKIIPTSAFAAQSQNSRSDFWIGDSGASYHVTNDAHPKCTA